MPIGTSLLVDSVSHAIGNGQIQSLSTAQVSTKYTGAVKTPSANFSMVFQGQHLSFTKNVPFPTTPDLLAALTAAGAPVA